MARARRKPQPIPSASQVRSLRNDVLFKTWGALGERKRTPEIGRAMNQLAAEAKRRIRSGKLNFTE